MPDEGVILSTELTRIIQSPYPASLSTLVGYLAQANVPTIRACIHDQTPCAVSKLVTIVCDALPLWSYTLDILHYLCHAPEFSSELLLVKPGLLNGLLTKANSSQQAFADYASLCVLILSRPLPESVPLPAAAQDFFLRVFQNAVQEPNVDTLKSVYCMLNGACHQLLRLLSHDAQQQFDQELCRILSSSSAGKNSMLLLWCFGIVLLAERPIDCQNRQDSPIVPLKQSDDQWKTSSGRKLFVSMKGLYKTITLTCMSVVWAMKPDVGVSEDEAVQGIRIASRLLQFVEEDARKSWSSSSALAESTLAKLFSKIERGSTSSRILFEAVCFGALIIGHQELPSALTQKYEQCVMTALNTADPDHLQGSLSMSLSMFMPHVQESTLQSLLVNILDACDSGSSSCRLLNLTVLADQLAVVASTSDPIHNRVSSALSLENLQQRLWNFVQNCPRTEENSCRSYAMSMHRSLISATIASLLTMVFARQSEERSFPFTLTFAIINMQRELRTDSTPCSHTTRIAQNTTISLFQQSCTPYTGQHMQDWRDRLSSELASQGQYQRDAVVRSIAQICEDLETRCSTIEKPLRQEQAKSRALEQRVSQMIEEILSLQARITDDELHLQGLEDERDSIEKEKRDISETKDCISAAFEELRLQFTDEKREAEVTLRAAHEEHNCKELELRSTILHHEDDLRLRATECQDLKDVIKRLHQAQKQKEEDCNAIDEQRKQLEIRLKDTELILIDEREHADRRAEEMGHLTTRNADLENHLHGTKSELERVSTSLSNLESSHRVLIQSSEEMLKNLNVKYSNDMDAVAIEADKERAEFQAQLQTVLHDSRQSKNAHDKVQRELEILRTAVPPLEARINELEEVCSEQEEELNDLRTLRRNVLASMGLASQNSLAIRTAYGSQRDDSVSHPTREARAHRRRKSAILMQEVGALAPQGINENTSKGIESATNAPFAFSESQSSQGSEPMPKRSKPRPSLKVPAMRTPVTQNPVLVPQPWSKKISPSKRSALNQMSPNRRHTTVDFGNMENGGTDHDFEKISTRKRRGSLQDIEPTDLDIYDDFLAGTGRLPGNDDETVTEL